MKKILFLSTGGTFNKHYSEATGAIAIDTQAKTLHELAEKWRAHFEIRTLIGKDSLDMDAEDRALLLQEIIQSGYEDIIVIHGTDTMDLSAAYIAQAALQKRIIFTGAMVPYRVDRVEATANVAMAYGYLQADIPDGVYISMNGVIGEYREIYKERSLGRFVRRAR